ncbi:hypothetical protein [Succiniclasticum ruminis]|uniref:Uncharacterized protein n=1 Tax=Succiniclasticum ruminis DSM 9236 TaxID=1123323 RepID=A0A1I2DY09_9FIRM|nr:hypothetical protein [Succiniclasticum ruminis]SFE85524.1 hypothetical protein SAMN05216245_1267 [Succiniclasticum ruminis DSM 9236]
MPKPEDIEVIIKRRPDWEFLQKLPKELHGFSLEEGGQLKGHEFVLGSYVNEEARRRLELIYTKETFDYVPVRQVGLLRYRDFRYITRDKDVFAEWITGAIDRLVEETTPTYVPRSGHLLRDKGILDWHFPDTLPERVGNFVKFIGPQCPLDFINNATVILDYADFDAGNELVFLYNRVRNEFYAENKKHLIPNTIHEFDAKNLEDLEVLLAESLEPYLLDLGNDGK